MFKRFEILPIDERLRLVDALREIRRSICWKPGKGLKHLEKRKKMKHLSPSASMSDYEKVICDVVRNERNILYLYDFSGIHYYAVRGFAHDNEWLILFGAGGVMETAFPPELIDDYLERRGFVFLGHIEEVLKWTREARN